MSAGEELNPDIPITVLDKIGFTGILATNSVLEFDRPLRHGDVLRSKTIFKKASERKKTKLGEGYFLSWTSIYIDENDEEVGRQIFTVYKFDTSTIA